MSVLEYVLGDFWHFCAALVLVVVTLSGVADVVAAARRKP